MRLIHKVYILLILLTLSVVSTQTIFAASTPRSAKLKPRKSLTPKVITYAPKKITTPTPTQKITQTEVSSPSAGQSTQTDDIKSFLIDKVNDYRRSQGLDEVKMDPNTCDFAKIRAEEIVTNFNHDGFRNRIESKTLPYNDYSEVTENIAMTSNFQEVVDLWINSPGHAANMRKNTPYVCIEKSGNYYAYEGWRP